MKRIKNNIVETTALVCSPNDLTLSQSPIIEMLHYANKKAQTSEYKKREVQKAINRTTVSGDLKSGPVQILNGQSLSGLLL